MKSMFPFFAAWIARLEVPPLPRVVSGFKNLQHPPFYVHGYPTITNQPQIYIEWADGMTIRILPEILPIQCYQDGNTQVCLAAATATPCGDPPLSVAHVIIPNLSSTTWASEQFDRLVALVAICTHPWTSHVGFTAYMFGHKVWVPLQMGPNTLSSFVTRMSGRVPPPSSPTVQWTGPPNPLTVPHFNLRIYVPEEFPAP